MKSMDIDFPEKIKKLFMVEFEYPEQIYDYEAQLCEFFSNNYEQFTSYPDLFKIRTNEFRVIRSLRPQYFSMNQYNAGLEIGCSFGFKTLLLLPFCRSIIGVDIPEKYFTDISAGFNTSIEFARYIINEKLEVKDISFVASYLDNLDIASNSVDFLYSEYVLEHVPQYEDAISELHRVMKLGAVMIHTVPISLCHILPFFEKNMRAKLSSIVRSFSKKVLNLLKRAKNDQGSSDLTWNLLHIPHSHSEYLAPYDFMSQLNVYLLENYIFPMVERGFDILEILQSREHNRVIIARKVK
jgi:SAM-dependent methyltransferase